MRPRIQPRETPAQGPNLQLSVRKETLVNRRDLQLSARGRLDAFGHFHDLVRIEIEAHDRVVRFRMLRLLLDGKAVSRFVEFCNSITLRIVHPVTEHRSVAILFDRADRLPEHSREARSVEDIVAQDKAHRIPADELLTDQECLSQTVRGGLFGILQTDSIIRAVAQQAPEARKVLRRRDQKNIPDARQHQNRQRVIDHRLVVDRKQLFAHPPW